MSLAVQKTTRRFLQVVLWRSLFVFLRIIANKLIDNLR